MIGRPSTGPRATPADAHGPHLTPEMIGAAPELAVLALLDETIGIARLALFAAQPALLGDPPPWRVTTDLRAAMRLLRAANALSRAAAHYRCCVLRDLHDDDRGGDDIPF